MNNEEKIAADLFIATVMDWAARADLIPELTNHLGSESTKEALAAYERNEKRQEKIAERSGRPHHR